MIKKINTFLTEVRGELAKVSWSTREEFGIYRGGSGIHSVNGDIHRNDGFCSVVRIKSHIPVNQ